MRRIFTAAVAAALSVTVLFASPALASGPTTWKVQAGSGSFSLAGPSVSGNRFYPDKVAIHAGDSVQFNVVGAHLLAVNRPAGPIFFLFGPPSFSATLATPTQRVNSSIIGDTGPAAFKLTFAPTLPTGHYTVICGLHIGMTESVDVLPSGPLPKTQAQYDAAAQKEITRDLDKFSDVAAKADKKTEHGNKNPTVWVGAGNKRGSNLSFFPSVITVHVGQTVAFLKTHDPTEPHTVTFGTLPAGGDPIAELIPSGGNTVNAATGVVNSGFLSTKRQFAFYQLPGPFPFVQATEFDVTFTSMGTFTYVCAIHDGIGMKGVVIVKP
jgi:plastocyanin